MSRFKQSENRAGLVPRSFFAAGVLLAAASGGACASPASMTILVPADAGWFDTGVDVAPSEKVEIFASGLWTNGGQPTVFVGPNGFLNLLLPETVVPTAPFGSLVGRIGETPFPIGSSSIQALNGRLFLAMNDIANTQTDNVGYLVVTIEVTVNAHAQILCTSEQCALQNTQ